MKQYIFTRLFIVFCLFSNTITLAQSNCFSLRFNDNDLAKLTKTFTSVPASKRAQTYSFWVKRGTLTDGIIFSGWDGSSTNVNMIGFISDQLYMMFGTGNLPAAAIYKTNELFRDPSAWYHFVVAINIDEPVGADRLKTWVNGKQVTDWFSGSSLPSNDLQMLLNNQYNVIGAHPSFTLPFDGYMHDFYAVDGQTLTAASFGQINSISGEWEPIAYIGPYGNNGFHLNFSDNLPAADIGKDVSGNGHNWSLNNIVATDQMIDVPTNNFCTLLPINTCSFNELSDGNLNIQGSGSGQGAAGTSFGVSSGKWYWESTLISGNPLVADYGVLRTDIDMCSNSPSTSPANSLIYYRGDGSKQNAGTNSVYANSFSASDVIGVALDMDAGTIEYYKNGVSQGIAFTGLIGTYFPAVFDYGITVDAVSYLNFGQGGLPCLQYDSNAGGYFNYPPPTGYKTLCASNLLTPSIIKGSDYFASISYIGNGTAQSVSGLSFSPDFVWVKNRTVARSHQLFDTQRGVASWLASNLAQGELINAIHLTAFDPGGFSVGTDEGVNEAGSDMISWNWKESPIAGVDVQLFTGTGVNTAINHSLSLVPKMIIIKNRTNSSNWAVYHTKMDLVPESGYLDLNSNASFSSDASHWNNTAPSASVFSIGTNSDVNLAGNNYVAYLFSDIEGFSKMGSYTGNGSNDGPFIWTGFKPSYVLIKRTDAAGDWYIWDTERDKYSVVSHELLANLPNVEMNNSDLDANVNGIKIRNANANFNATGANYIFASFAKVPFKYASGTVNPFACTQPEPPHTELIVCDSAFINGNWYFSSQTVIDTLPSSLSCDSIVITDLTIPSSINPIIVTVQNNVSCKNGANGNVTIAVSGGISPYSFLWTPAGGTGTTATGLSAGTYTVTVTDSSQCDTVFKIITIAEPNALAIDSMVTNVSCNGGNNGSAMVMVLGGTTPYSYSWSSGGTAVTENNLSAATYTLTVTDSNSCMAMDTIIVSEPPPLTTDVISSANVTCNGGNNGSATAGANGGVVPYAYSWSSGSTTSIANNLSAGSYIVTVTDSNSCASIDSVTILEPLPMSTTMSTSPTVCTGSTGTATAMVTGGTVPYTYLWSSGGTMAIEDSLSAGNYIVTVSDSNSCIKTDSIAIASVDSIISLTFTTVPAVCTSATGVATAVVNGGTMPYTYVWSSGGTISIEDSLATGAYTVTVTDVNGCAQSEQTTIGSTNPLTLSVSSTPSACDTATGTATVVPANGIPPYVYLWSTSPVQTASTAVGLASGNYTVTVTDSNGCSQSQPLSVVSLFGPTATVAASVTSITLGDNIQLMAVGGTTYSWTPVTGLNCTACQNPVATPVETTTYCVTVSDTSNCTDSACITITVEMPCGKLEVPTAFSPNNDGYNDRFVLQGLDKCVSTFVFRIFDRWGEKVFETESLTILSWDGTFKGKPLNPAVFVYYIDATFISGEHIIKKGNISLIR